MDNVVMIHTQTDVMAVYKFCLLDAGLVSRLKWLRVDPTIKGLGAYVYGDTSMRWAQEALNEAKSAGLIDKYEAHDMLALAAIAISAAIIEEVLGDAQRGKK